MKGSLFYILLTIIASISIWVYVTAPISYYNVIESYEGRYQYNVANYHVSQDRLDFIVTYNEMIQDYYGDEDFPLKSQQEVNVCIIDNFTSKVESEISHGEQVAKAINKRFTGDVREYDAKNNSYRHHHFNEDKSVTKKNVTSYGEEVDVIVFNAKERIDEYSLTGSSFATPVVTSSVANMLSQGISKEVVKELILASGEMLIDKNGYAYTDFGVDTSNVMLIEYLNNNNTFFEYKD